MTPTDLCVPCSGTGLVSSTQKCSYCQGSGKVEVKTLPEVELEAKKNEENVQA